MLPVIWYGLFHESLYNFTEILVSLQLDYPTKIRSPLTSSRDQDIREEINTSLYPECGKRWAFFLVFKMYILLFTMVKYDPMLCELFFSSGFADCDMKYSSTPTSHWTMGALTPTIIWGILKLLMSPLPVRSQTSRLQGLTPSEAAQWIRRPQETQDSSWNNEIATWIFLNDTIVTRTRTEHAKPDRH